MPFYCVRAVTDLAGESLANDFNKALRSDGHFDTMLIIVAALRHPAARLAGIDPAAEAVRPRREALGEFLCRLPILR